MPFNIPEILDPRVWLEVIQGLEAPPNLKGVTLFDERDADGEGANWVVKEQTRSLAAFRAPDADRQLVPRKGFKLRSSTWLHMDEEKMLPSSTLRWMRAPADNQQAAINAETEIRDEAQDLIDRISFAEEWLIWEMLKGTITVTVEDSTVVVDFGMPADNLPSPSADWSTAGTNIKADLIAWKQVSAKSRLPITDMWINSQTADYLFENTALRGLIPEKVKEQFWAEGVINRFFGMTLVAYDQGYVDSAGAEQTFIAPNELFMFNRGVARRLRGPVVNAHAPNNSFGRYGRNWIPEDGKSIMAMAEWTGMPVLLYPNAPIYVADVTTP